LEEARAETKLFSTHKRMSVEKMSAGGAIWINSCFCEWTMMWQDIPPVLMFTLKHWTYSHFGHFAACSKDIDGHSVTSPRTLEHAPVAGVLCVLRKIV
jgi:hypothetical protein